MGWRAEAVLALQKFEQAMDDETPAYKVGQGLATLYVIQTMRAWRFSRRWKRVVNADWRNRVDAGGSALRACPSGTEPKTLSW